MIHKLTLTESQFIGYDKLCDERAAFDARIARFRAACLVELGGHLNEPWTFDEIDRSFKINVPNNPLTNDTNPSIDAGAETESGSGLAQR